MGWTFGEWLGWEKANLVQSIFCKNTFTSLRIKTEVGSKGELGNERWKEKDRVPF